MQQYIVRRLILSLPVIFFVMVLTFILMRLVPGDVTMTRITEGAGYNEEVIERLRERLGFNDPLHVQFGKWFGNVLQGDFGRSLDTERPTFNTFIRAARVTLELGLVSITIGMVIAIPIGVLAAVKQDSIADYIFRVASTIGISVPDFFSGTLVVVFLALWWKYQAPYGFTSPLEDPWANFQQIVFPAMILGIRYSSSTMRLTRAIMLEVLRQDYVRTARAKGLASRTVIAKHALQNAMIPIVTIIGAQLTFVLGGTIIVETLFSLPGVGQLTFTSINLRDYTQVQTNLLLLSLVVVGGNLITDLTYGFFDPRIRYD